MNSLGTSEYCLLFEKASIHFLEYYQNALKENVGFRTLLFL